MSNDIKQVIVIRKDLKMRRGKEIAQGAHASIAFLTKQLKEKSFILDEHTKTNINQYEKIYGKWNGSLNLIVYLKEVEKFWLQESFTKICVTVNSEEELLDIEKKAKEANLECNLIIDSGATEFNRIKTATCLAIGPDYSEKIDKVTGHLKLY